MNLPRSERKKRRRRRMEAKAVISTSEAGNASACAFGIFGLYYSRYFL